MLFLSSELIIKMQYLSDKEANQILAYSDKIMSHVKFLNNRGIFNEKQITNISKLHFEIMQRTRSVGKYNGLLKHDLPIKKFVATRQKKVLDSAKEN